MMSNKKNYSPKIFFFGAPHFSEEILKYLLLNNVEIDTVVTHPDQPVGRKKILTPTLTKSLAQKHNINIKEFSSLRDTVALNFFKQASPDLFIVASYGAIIPQNILDTARQGALNVHPSLLPKLRGASPIQTALLKGLATTGATIMLMDAGMDTGKIIKQAEIEISPTEIYPQLEQRLIDLSNKLLLSILNSLSVSLASARDQDDDKASYTKLLKKKDGLIDWQNSAREIYNKWKAFYTWPKIYTFYNNQKLTLTEIELFSKNDIIKGEKVILPGTVFRDDNKRILIQTGAGQVEIKKLQLAGKQELGVRDFLNGQKGLIGACLD